jgi:hypothetical protein
MTAPTLLAVLLLGLFAVGSLGHGSLTQPPSRNVVAPINGETWWVTRFGSCQAAPALGTLGSPTLLYYIYAAVLCCAVLCCACRWKDHGNGHGNPVAKPVWGPGEICVSPHGPDILVTLAYHCVYTLCPPQHPDDESASLAACHPCVWLQVSAATPTSTPAWTTSS